MREAKEFLFFGYDDKILFTRNDAESANWQVDEFSLTCLFPYDPGKVIVRGMRIGFEDAEGVLQPFEVRKVRTYEPDHYQEVTAEHIVISELTDVHTDDAELTNVTPSSALTSILNAQPSGVSWAVGNVTATATSSGDITVGSAFQNIRMIEQNWNVYINPRVTFNASGITGRYLDIVPATGVWHGVRLSIDKNADEMGVTVDDTEVKTAMYGYGGSDHTVSSNQLEYTSEKITLAGYNWTNPPSGCSKATADNYVVDTAATAMYGRNGVPRFGFYQNADITDQATLAQKTWEALQASNKPDVTVDCMVKDLYRMGYHDEPIRLHDTVFVEICPINDVLQLEIIKLSVDLLDPTATRPTIGSYIPNIIYIQRQTADAATGGASGRLSGRSKDSQDKKNAEWSEFIADYTVNNMIFSYHAKHIDHDDKVLNEAGMDLDANGAIIYAQNNEKQIGSKFQLKDDQIALVVTTTGTFGNYTNKVNAASICAGINDDTGTGQSYVTIDADRIKLTSSSGVVTLDNKIDIDSNSYIVLHGNTVVYGSSSNSVSLVNGDITAQNINIAAGQNLTFYGSGLTSNTSIGKSTADVIVTGFGTVTESGGQVTIPYSTVKNPTAGSNSQNINFNIASMQYFIDSIEAAKLEGWNAACDKVTRVSNTIYGPQKNSYGNYTQYYQAHYSASSHSYSSPWMKVNGHTYWSDHTESLSGYTGDAQFNSGYDSYSASSFYWS